MNWQTVVLVLLVVLWAAAQYGLAVHALLDLSRRPTVRGNNKVVWALVILGIPIAGALLYTVYGPTSFIRRGTDLVAAQATTGRSTPRMPTTGQAGQPNDHPTGQAPSRLHEKRANRSAPQPRQHHQPVDRLPDLPELADIDGERAEIRPQPAPRRAATRLVRQAQRKIRR